jgi:pre-rRNA-processing protein IPI1
MLRIRLTKRDVSQEYEVAVADPQAIALPSQNPLARALTTAETDPNAEPTTSRGLHLTEVLLTLRHPNAGVRKDGLAALKEVLVAGAEMGTGIGKREGETGKVIAGVVRLLGDDVSTTSPTLTLY